MSDYRLLDCGNGQKVEILGEYKVIRPCPQAIWKPFNPKLWEGADSIYSRTTGEKGEWKAQKNPDGAKRNKLGMGIPVSWTIKSPSGLQWQIEPNEFGNVGVFTEHWQYGPDLVSFFNKKGKILNLFSYTGSSCVDLIKAGYKMTVVDSSTSAIDGFTHNLGLNHISRDGQKLVLEDVNKFILREVRRESQYDGIMCDAPSFGRGTKGEVFNIEDQLVKMLETCKSLLSKQGRLVLTLHSPRFTPEILKILCEQIFAKKRVEVSEILNPCESGVNLPSGFLVKVS
jgi:23S rRNA (cytosine1962-C5)-methyltransferase